MTREEAIHIISQMIKDEEGFLSDNTVEAHKMAIKALEQQPCDDLISRQAALNAMYALCDTGETLKENPWREIHILMPSQMHLILYDPSHQRKRQGIED